MMDMTPIVNTEENYTRLGATQTGNVEGQYDDIIEEAAKSGQVQPASKEDSYNGSTVGQLATAVRAEIFRARRMRLFMLTVIIVTFVITVGALVLVIMKMADGEGSAAPKQETKVQGVSTGIKNPCSYPENVTKNRTFIEESLPGDFAFYFPTKGDKDYVNIWGMPSLKQFTLCFWMKSSAGNDGTVLSYAVPGEDNELLFFDHTNIKMYVGGQARLLGISSANDGKWHHICVSWRSSDGAWQGYKDGTLTKSGTGFKKGYTIKEGGSLTLGQEQDAVGSQFDSNQTFIGTLSNLNLWSLILPVEKIKDLSKSCKQDWGGDGDVYKWIDFLYGIRGGTRIVMPSPCPR